MRRIARSATEPSGRGDGPLAGKLPIRPADLTEPHLFAHKVGEMYWWVSYGRDNGVMPGFADKLTSDQRWDLINFVLARAAGDLTNGVGSQISATTAPPVPDFAFERSGAQNTLSQTLKNGPVLLVLFGTPVPRTRLEHLASITAATYRRGFDRDCCRVAPTNRKGTLRRRGRNRRSEYARAISVTYGRRRDGADAGSRQQRPSALDGERRRWRCRRCDAARRCRRVASIPVAAANHAGHAH